MSKYHKGDLFRALADHLRLIAAQIDAVCNANDQNQEKEIRELLRLFDEKK